MQATQPPSLKMANPLLTPPCAAASVHSLEEELQQSRISEELARQSLIAQHHEVGYTANI